MGWLDFLHFFRPTLIAPWSELTHTVSISILGIDGYPLGYLTDALLRRLKATAGPSTSDIDIEIPVIGVCAKTLRIGPHRIATQTISGSRKTQAYERQYYREYKDGVIFALDSRNIKGLVEAQEEFSYACAEAALDGAPVLCLLMEMGDEARFTNEGLTATVVEELFKEELDVTSHLKKTDAKNYKRLQDSEGKVSIAIGKGRPFKVHSIQGGETWEGLREGLEWFVAAMNERKGPTSYFAPCITQYVHKHDSYHTYDEKKEGMRQRIRTLPKEANPDFDAYERLDGMNLRARTLPVEVEAHM